MRHLILLRHAKAEASSADGDFGRRLAPRGERQAATIARWLADKPYAPELVVASSAQRTRETADIVGAGLRLAPQREDDRDLYNADSGEILGVARRTPASVARLMFVGHNPGIAELALLLAGNGAPTAGQRMARKFPTCACAIFALDILGWDQLAPGMGDLLDFVTPNILNSAELDD